MGTETEQLVVALEARVRDFERNFQKASRTASTNFDQIERRSKQATQRLETQMSSMSSRMIGIGKAMAAGFAGGLLAGGLTGILGRGGDIARGIAQIGDEAKRAGLSMTAFQELKYVAEQNRVGVDSLVDGIKELNLRADEFITTGGGSAAEAFARLGYDAQTLSTRLADPSALFTEIIGKLGQLDRAAAIRIADEIFGGTGGERFVQLIEQGEDALNDTKREAHALGIVLSDDVIKKADELDRRFNAVANTVGSALKQAIVGATLALVDFINTFNQLPAMQNLAAATAPLSTRSLSLMQDQLSSKEAALQRSLANPATSGWFGTSLGAEGDQAALRTEITALTEAIKTRQDPSQFDVNSVFAGLSTPTYDSVEAMQTALAPPTVPAAIIPPPSGGGGGGGGGASSMREERDAAAELIVELENELRLLGLSETERQIDAELRRAGAGATDAQKQSIAQLVTQIEAESAAMEQLEEASENAQGMAKDFLGGIIGDLRSGVDGVTALANAFGNLADKLLDMALDSIVSSIFSGIGSGGGLLGLLGLSGGGVVEAATGGLIRGPGTSKSDSIPARLSDGEFVVNAAATRQNIDLLRAINAGKVAAFGDGGLAGRSLSARFAPTQNVSIGDINVTTQSTGDTARDEQNAQMTAKAIDTMLEKKMAKWATNQSRPGGMLAGH